LVTPRRISGRPPSSAALGVSALEHTHLAGPALVGDQQIAFLEGFALHLGHAAIAQAGLDLAGFGLAALQHPHIAGLAGGLGLFTAALAGAPWRGDAASLADDAATLPPLAPGAPPAGLPPSRAAGPAAAWPGLHAGGREAQAVLGTSSTSWRSVAVMVAVAVMPGRRLRSALSTSRRWCR
jgi:hypothetical protein